MRKWQCMDRQWLRIFRRNANGVRRMLRNCELTGMECLDLGSMEGLMPALMCRGGAGRVVATDALSHCVEKMATVRHY